MKKLAFLLSTPLAFLSSHSALAEAIEDNSFLVEEAYNQEPGIVQFIQTYQKDKSKDTFYSLTVEIPAPNEMHQISFMIPHTHLEGFQQANEGIGDVGLNYRYQLFSSESLAIAPRFSLLLPTGDEKKGLGNGVVGYQTNWAFSAKVNPSLVLHANVGATLLPEVDTGSEKKHFYGSNAALSFVWLVQDNFNVLVEYVSNSMENAAGVETEATINPGFRYAVNFEKSQLVLGASAPTPALYTKQGGTSLFVYASYEPKLW